MFFQNKDTLGHLGQDLGYHVLVHPWVGVHGAGGLEQA